MLSNFSLKKLTNPLKSLFKSQNTLNKSVDDLKEQIEDHLHAINESTNEIQSNYEYSLEMESKLNKLAERVDEISMLNGLNQNQKTRELPKLTIVEKEVFLALYSLCEEKEHTTYKEISKAVNLSETLIMNYITILVEKGIPIIKSYSNDTTKLKLSSYFKTLQTKKDIVKINADYSQQSALNTFITNK